MLAGLFLGLGFILTGELAIPIGLHMSWNFFQGSVFGFPVSGLNSAASFIGIHQSGPDLFTGGVFGPEAGLVGLSALVLGSVVIVLWLRWTRGAAQLEQRLAVFSPPAPRPVKAHDEAQQPASGPE
jgi:membrane protease YdiL (CAAX protease family)